MPQKAFSAHVHRVMERLGEFTDYGSGIQYLNQKGIRSNSSGYRQYCDSVVAFCYYECGFVVGRVGLRQSNKIMRIAIILSSCNRVKKLKYPVPKTQP